MLEGIGEKFKSLNDRGPQAPSPAYEEVTSAAGGGCGPRGHGWQTFRLRPKKSSMQPGAAAVHNS
jgi:hypothetical protein